MAILLGAQKPYQQRQARVLGLIHIRSPHFEYFASLARMGVNRIVQALVRRLRACHFESGGRVLSRERELRMRQRWICRGSFYMPSQA